MDCITLTKNYNYAYEFAKLKHAGQFRKDGITPYVQHPLSVAQLVYVYKSNSSNLKILIEAALLHDTLEDTYTSYRELKEIFGEETASLVLEVTSAKVACKLLGKSTYLKYKMKNMTSYALIIKLCDRLANLKDCKSLSNEQITKLYEETYIIIDFIKKNRTLTATQKRLIDDVEIELNNLKSR